MALEDIYFKESGHLRRMQLSSVCTNKERNESFDADVRKGTILMFTWMIMEKKGEGGFNRPKVESEE